MSGELIERLFGSGERSKPGILDLAFTAFMRSREENDEDGGPTDWMNDTRPLLQPHVDEMRSEVEAALSALHAAELALTHEIKIKCDLVSSLRAVEAENTRYEKHVEDLMAEVERWAAQTEAEEPREKQVRAALTDLLPKYVELSSARSDGFWNADAEPVVINARRALASKEGGK